MRLGKALMEMTLPELNETKKQLNLSEENEKIMDMLSKGKSIIYIADELCMSTSSVSNHIKFIRHKLEKIS